MPGSIPSSRSPLTVFTPLLLLVVSGCAQRPNTTASATLPVGSAAEATASDRGHVLPPQSGTPLVFCTAPGLSVDLRLDSTVAPGTPVAMGTGELAAGASNVGRHPETDEVIYFLTAGGRAFVATDTAMVEPGLMLYIPRGVTHGFLSPPDQPMRFVWVNVPQMLAQRFRANGVAPGTVCPPRTP